MRAEITRLTAKGKGRGVAMPIEVYVWCLTAVMFAIFI